MFRIIHNSQKNSDNSHVHLLMNKQKGDFLQKTEVWIHGTAWRDLQMLCSQKEARHKRPRIR